MIVEIFDDWKSIIHTVAGGLSYFFPLSLSYSYSTKLQNTLSFEKTKHTLLETSSSSALVIRSSG